MLLSYQYNNKKTRSAMYIFIWPYKLSTSCNLINGPYKATANLYLIVVERKI